jgi:hypothetical protein
MQEKRLRSHASVPRQLAGEEPDPLVPEEMEKAIMEMPRNPEVIDLLKSSRLKERFLRDNSKAT